MGPILIFTSQIFIAQSITDHLAVPSTGAQIVQGDSRPSCRCLDSAPTNSAAASPSRSNNRGWRSERRRQYNGANVMRTHYAPMVATKLAGAL